MLSTFYKGIDVETIIRLLPADQIKHISNVRILVGKMMEELPNCGIYPKRTAEMFKYFNRAAFFHDIGKVGVPPEILSKPGKLTLEEYHIIQNHTLIGEELFQYISSGKIQGMPEYLIPLARDSAVYHHEWWNGKGYPYGIGGEKIPLIARITSICDSYDAMTSNRTYRKAHSHDYACGELKKNAGTQFDPELIQIFLDHEAEFLRLYEENMFVNEINGVF